MSRALDAMYGRLVSSAPRAIRFVLLAIASAALLGALLVGPAIEASDTGAAVAKKKSPKGVITGSLNKRGYTLLALSASSPNASSVHVTGNRFRLRAPRGMPVKPRALRGCVTLHLRAPNGTYAGPVVLGTKRKGLVIVGVNATNGASLGAIKIDAVNGYARTTRKPPASALCSKLVARANRKGIPIGNRRNVGLVRSRVTGSGQDPDLDGVPNSLDADDNGNLILDRLDRSATAGASRAAHESQAQRPNAFMNLTTTFSGAVDVNAYGSSDQDVREAERTRLSLAIMGGGFDPGTPVELDCGGRPDPNNPNGWIGGVSYCTRGGTGRLLQGPGNTPGFPTPCCDADGDGLAELRQIGPMVNPMAGFFGMPISPGATPDQIRPGDVLIMKGTRNGAPVDLSSTLGLVLSTPPALARYDDRQGDSGTLSYPFETTSRAFPEIPVRANASGNVVVDLTFWRAQRLRIATEPGSGSWMDVGHMSHVALAENAGPLQPGVFSALPNGGCPASSYSNVDAKLSLQPPNGQFITPYLKDLEADRPTDRAKPFANSFSYTLNLTNCLAAYGVSFNIGESRGVSFWGVSQPIEGKFATASSLVTFRRVG